MSLQKIWKSSSNLITSRKNLTGFGTANAAVSTCGFTTTQTNVSEEFNNTTWETTTAYGSSYEELASCGTVYDGLVFGGYNGSVTGVTNSYNGVVWTSLTAMTTSRRQLAGCGTKTSAVAFGGTTGSISNITETFNGSTWTTGNTMSTARTQLAGTGSQTSALAIAGSTGSVSSITEELTDGSWSSGGTIGTARNLLAASGLQNLAVAFGGNTGSTSVSTTDEYNGSSWTNVNGMISSIEAHGGCGNQDLSISFGGTSSTSLTGITFEYVTQYISSTGNVNVTYSGVTASNAGTGTYPIMYFMDCDTFPFAGDITNRNSYSAASDANYTAVASDDSSNWVTTDPGSGDISTVEFQIDLDSLGSYLYSDHTLQITFKGYITDGTGNVSFYLHNPDLEYQIDSYFELLKTIELSSSASIAILIIPYTKYKNFIGTGNKLSLYVTEPTTSSSFTIQYIEFKFFYAVPETGYHIQRSVNDSSKLKDISVVTSTGTYQDTDVSFQNYYYYRIGFFDGTQYFEYSNIVGQYHNINPNILITQLGTAQSTAIMLLHSFDTNVDNINIFGTIGNSTATAIKIEVLTGHIWLYWI